MAPREVIGPLPRLLALAIDAAWVLGVSLPWMWWASAPGDFGPTWAWFGGVLLLSLGAVPCWLGLGGTPGQLLLGQRVVDDRGQPRLQARQALLRWAAAWATAASLLYAPLWRHTGREPRAWHDRLSGTTVVERDPDIPEGVPIRHWAGELPLAESLWIHGLLLPLPLLLLLGAVEAASRLDGLALRAAGLLLLPGWTLLLVVMVWGAVGAWRAAGRPLRTRRGGPPPAWRPLGARGLVSVAAAAVLLMAGVNLAPRLFELAALLVGHDPLGTATATVSADGRRLHVKGPLGLGSAAKVRALLDASPQLRWVVLESSAGRLPEALAIADALRARGLPTRATGECSGVCPFVFLAGSQRQLLPGARLGLQRLSAGTFNPPYQGLLNRELRQRLAAAGLTPHLVTKTLATPPTRSWYPESDELAAAHLVSVPERPLDVELPGPLGATVADYAEALSASPLWQAVERRFPGVQALAAEHMGAASAQGADAVQVAGHEVVAALLPPLLVQASPETRWLFTDLLLAQMNALAAVDPELCRKLLLGDAAAHRRLPRELAWREAEWLLGALGEAPRGTPARRPNPLELEVIRRTLGQRAPQHLAMLWRPTVTPPAGEPNCDRGRAMLTEMATLAAPQRRLALRLMYERE
jgi:uncharacterized RDD family membrane protein YckC